MVTTAALLRVLGDELGDLALEIDRVMEQGFMVVKLATLFLGELVFSVHHKHCHRHWSLMLLDYGIIIAYYST